MVDHARSGRHRCVAQCARPGGLYLRLLDEGGILGLIGFILATIGTALFAGAILFIEVATLPFIASLGNAEELLESAPPTFLAIYGATFITYAHFAADLDVLRRHLGQDKVWIMGHSRAGVDAMTYALTYPDGCEGLILLDSLPAFDQVHTDDVQARLEARQNEPWFEKAFAAFNDRTMPESDEAFAGWLFEILPLYFYDIAKLEQNRDHFKLKQALPALEAL